MTELKQKASGQSDDFMRIQDLFYLCLAQWKWFVLSLFVTLTIATVYILRTPSVYTRSASILIKEDTKGNSLSSGVEDFADMGLFQSNTNVNNELLALQSPAIMYEVVKRLHLDMNYYVPGRFHEQVAYGRTLPVSISIQGLAENEAAGFQLELSSNGEVFLSDFTRNGEDIGGSDELTGTLADTISSPIGNIVVMPSSYYTAGTNYSIEVVRSGIYGTANSYSSNLTVSLSDEKASVISLTVEFVSSHRGEEILNSLIAIFNDIWVSD